jgi:ribosomal protein L11 methyltransferase
MKSEFIAIHIYVPEESQDILIGLLSSLDFSGIEQSQDEMTIIFNTSDYTDEIETYIIEAAKNNQIACNILNKDIILDQNWNKEWEDSLEPIIVNDTIAITPEWKRDEVHHPLTIIINPQMAFGTGYHPTTRMVCRELQEWVEPHSNWMDAGCGSGVLGILASKLGAKDIFAFDNDEWSVENAKDNAKLNSIDNMKVEQADVFTLNLSPVHGIAANMYRNIILPNMTKFHAALNDSKGIMIVSGILAIDADEIIVSAIKHGFEHVKTLQEQDWVAITFRAL